MKIPTLIVAGAAAFAVLASTAGAVGNGATRHVGPARHASGHRVKTPARTVAKTKPASLIPTSVKPLPPNLAAIAPATLRPEDSTALQCTSLLCSTAIMPLIASSGFATSPEASISQFCEDDSYMCEQPGVGSGDGSTTTLSLTASSSDASLAQTPISQFCADNSYMC